MRLLQLYGGRRCLVGTSTSGATEVAYLLISHNYLERMIDIDGTYIQVNLRKCVCKACYVLACQLQNIGAYCLETFSVSNAFEITYLLKKERPFTTFRDYIGSAISCLSNGGLDLACD